MSNESAVHILRIREVVQRTGLKRSTIYKLINKRGFPRPIQLSPGAVGWRSDDLDDWIESRSRHSTPHVTNRKESGQ